MMQPIGQIILTVMDNARIDIKVNGLNPALVVYALEKTKAAILAGPSQESVAPATPGEAALVNGKPR